MKPTLLVVIGLVTLLWVACDDGGGGAPRAAGTTAPSPVTIRGSPAAELPCEVPDDIESYRWVWDIRMDIPGPEGGPGDDQLSSLLKELKGQDIPPENLGEVFYILFLTSFENGRVPVRMEYAFVAPDRTEQKIIVGDFETVGVTTGDGAWIKLGADGWRYGWREADVEDLMGPMPELSSLCEGFRSILPRLLGGEGEEEKAPGVPLFPDVYGVGGQREIVSGIAAIHYHVEEKDRVRITELLGGDDGDAVGAQYPLDQEAAFDWWIAKEGNWPIRMVVVVRGRDQQGRAATIMLSTQVKDLNDPSIKIEPPVDSD